MSEEHEIFQGGIDGSFGRCVDVRGSMREQVKELNETADCQGLELLRPQQSLPQMDILDDLEGYQLGHVQGARSGRALSQVPPVLTEECCVLVGLKGL